MGDLVRTIIVDSTVTARIPRAHVIDNSNIAAGDVVVNLSSSGQATYEKCYNSGIGCNGLHRPAMTPSRRRWPRSSRSRSTRPCPRTWCIAAASSWRTVCRQTVARACPHGRWSCLQPGLRSDCEAHLGRGPQGPDPRHGALFGWRPNTSAPLSGRVTPRGQGQLAADAAILPHESTRSATWSTAWSSAQTKPQLKRSWGSQDQLCRCPNHQPRGSCGAWREQSDHQVGARPLRVCRVGLVLIPGGNNQVSSVHLICWRGQW